MSALNDGAGDFDGAFLTLGGLDGRDARDEFNFKLNQSSTFSVPGNSLLNDENTFAKFSNSGGQLKFEFTGTGGVTPPTAPVHEVVYTIAYVNTALSRPKTFFFDWTFNDGNMGNQGSGGDLHTSGATSVSIHGNNVERLIADDLNAMAIDEGYYATEFVTFRFTATDILRRNKELSVSDERFGMGTTVESDTFELVLRSGTNIDYEYGRDAGPIGFVVSGHRAGNPEDVLGEQTFSLMINDIEVEGPSRLIGAAGNEYIFSTGGNDTLRGGEGDDRLHVSISTALPGVYDSGDGLDSLILHSSSASRRDLRSHDIRNIESLAIKAGHIIVSGQQFREWGGGLQLSHRVVNVHNRILEIQFGEITKVDLSNSMETVIHGGNSDDKVRIAAGDQFTKTIGSLARDHVLGGLGGDQMLGGLGDDTLIGGDSEDLTIIVTVSTDAEIYNNSNGVRITSEQGNDVTRSDVESVQFFGGTLDYAALAAVAQDATVTGTDTSENVKGSAASEQISGLGGADWITPGGGNDTINGGAGSDYALFSGNRADYTLTRTTATEVTVSGADGVDDVGNVEYFQCCGQYQE
ncbi:calcium-binding protein [Phaeobacter sp. NW0010-22]|uniref:calcium-binding protein n=1 Tax=Phaeobacter sp. NW0010-22 TaxID=3135907 RepID=UPI00310927AA